MTTVASAGAMLQREEESENEVRREDQDNINKFASLNARLNELRDERDALKVSQREQPSLRNIPDSLSKLTFSENPGKDGRCVDRAHDGQRGQGYATNG